jgi:hypothetical protein
MRRNNCYSMRCQHSGCNEILGSIPREFYLLEETKKKCNMNCVCACEIGGLYKSTGLTLFNIIIFY